MLTYARFLIVVVLAACTDAPAREPAHEPTRSRTDTMSTAMRVALDSFRTTVRGVPPTSIAGGAVSRDVLVQRFIDAVQRADTAALIRMTMSRAEFAHLYYPHTIYTRPPYELDAGTAWLLSKASSEKGLTRILHRFGGTRIELVDYECNAEPKQEGPNRYWDRCTVTARTMGAPPSMQWFGSIWERDGHFKFVSYVNDL